MSDDLRKPTDGDYIPSFITEHTVEWMIGCKRGFDFVIAIQKDEENGILAPTYWSIHILIPYANMNWGKSEQEIWLWSGYFGNPEKYRAPDDAYGVNRYVRRAKKIQMTRRHLWALCFWLCDDEDSPTYGGTTKTMFDVLRIIDEWTYALGNHPQRGLREGIHEHERPFGYTTDGTDDNRVVTRRRRGSRA